jgi:hypothetical protein
MKCKFCGKPSQYTLYLAGKYTDLCIDHYQRSGQRTIELLSGKKVIKTER